MREVPGYFKRLTELQSNYQNNSLLKAEEGGSLLRGAAYMPGAAFCESVGLMRSGGEWEASERLHGFVNMGLIWHLDSSHTEKTCFSREA